jgi:hypothetical protein
VLQLVVVKHSHFDDGAAAADFNGDDDDIDSSTVLQRMVNSINAALV